MFLRLILILLLLSPSAYAARYITIGCPLSTGFVYGWDAERGIRLAAEEINRNGGIIIKGKSYLFKVEVIDTRDLEPGVPVSEALLAVEKLILEKKADFLIGGPVRSEAALAAMDLIAKYKKISILTTGALTPKYHERIKKNYEKFKYCFRISSDAKWLVKETVLCLMKLKKEYGLNRIFIMVQNVAHARAGCRIIAKIVSSKGWTVTGEEIYPTGATEFSLGLIKAKKTRSHVILIWMDMPESAILLREWYDLKIPALPFGCIISAAEQPGFWKATKGKGQYCMANVVNAGNVPSDATDWTMRFYNAYKKRWKIEPEAYGCSSSYMAVYVIKEAIRKAQSLDPDKVVKALEQTDIMGVYGRIRFDKKSHQIIPSLDPKEGAVGSIFQWQKGKRVVIFPPRIAKGKILLPPWMRHGDPYIWHNK